MNSSARIPPETRKAPRASASLVSVPIDAHLKSDRQVRSLAARIDELTTQLAAIEAHTRGTLAQDLHDEMGAVLTAANLAISRAQYWLPPMPPPLAPMRFARRATVSRKQAKRVIESSRICKRRPSTPVSPPDLPTGSPPSARVPPFMSISSAPTIPASTISRLVSPSRFYA